MSKCDNYKRTRLILVSFFLVITSITSVFSFTIPNRPLTAVSDNAEIISPDVKNNLERLCNVVYKRTGVSIVLVTIRDLDGGDIDNTANQIYNKWGIGTKEKNEGALVLLAVNDRRIRIECGYGTEEYIPDVVTSRIIREAGSEYLSKGQWNEGLTYITHSLLRLTANHYGISPEELQQESGTQLVAPQGDSNKISAGKLLLIAILLLFLIGTPPGRAILLFMLLSSATRGRGMSGGGWGGDIGGGGFGGFGGGRSGGGGASGRF